MQDERERLIAKAHFEPLKASLIRWNVGSMVALTAMCATIVRVC